MSATLGCLEILYWMKCLEIEPFQNAKESLWKGEPAVPVCKLGDPAYPLLPFLMKEFSKGGKNSRERFFGQRLSLARMVIEYAFGWLKARFGCLRREMNINLKELPLVIHSCFILHNFCEIRQEWQLIKMMC